MGTGVTTSISFKSVIGESSRVFTVLDENRRGGSALRFTSAWRGMESLRIDPQFFKELMNLIES